MISGPVVFCGRHRQPRLLGDVAEHNQCEEKRGDRTDGDKGCCFPVFSAGRIGRHDRLDGGSSGDGFYVGRGWNGGIFHDGRGCFGGFLIEWRFWRGAGHFSRGVRSCAPRWREVYSFCSLLPVPPAAVAVLRARFAHNGVSSFSSVTRGNILENFSK